MISTNVASRIKVLLTQPLWPRQKQWGRFEKGAGNNSFAYGMASIAAVAQHNNFDVKVLDTQVEDFSEREFIEYLKKGNFDIIGIPCYTASVSFVFYTARICKKILPKAVVVVGAVHPTILPRKTLEDCLEIDIAVIGEGENTFLEILRQYENKKVVLNEIAGIAFREENSIKVNSNRPLVMDLDEFPMPAYDLFPMGKYITQISIVKRYPTFIMLASRGCPFHCTFCNATEVHGKRVRHKSVESIIQEIKYLQQKYGARGITFQDSTFTINKKWVYELCRAIIDNKLDIAWMCNSRVDTVDEDLMVEMKRAGCWGISFGLESGNQKSLDLIKKGTTVEQNRNIVAIAQRIGLFVTASYIICLPGENEDDVRNTISFAKSLGTQIAQFFLPIPFPGTGLWNICSLDGGLRKDVKWDDYSGTDFSNPVYVNPQIGKEKMIYYFNHSINTYYLQPNVIIKHLSSIRSIEDIKKYFFALQSLLRILLCVK